LHKRQFVYTFAAVKRLFQDNTTTRLHQNKNVSVKRKEKEDNDI